jgi:hypothetical protein
MSKYIKKHQLGADAFMVEQVLKNWHPLEDELRCWREILAIPWMRAMDNYLP